MPTLRRIGVVVSCLLLLCACSDGGDHVRREVDGLNGEAYRMHFHSLAQTDSVAREAERRAVNGGYADGMHEAREHRAFVCYMRAEFDEAERWYGGVLEESNNELLKLVADVGMMRVCQRRSSNRAFYDYRQSALQRMGRLQRESERMDAHQRVLWNYAVSDFYMASSTYYYYLRQEEQAEDALRQLDEHREWMEADSAQWAMYAFLTGNARNVDNRLKEEEVDWLMRAVSLAHYAGCEYVKWKALTSIAEDAVHRGGWRRSRLVYLRELLGIDGVDDDEMCLTLYRWALAEFEQQGTVFDISQTYIAMADFYLLSDEPEEALELLNCAVIEGVEQMPELMADIREHMCMVYSAMGMKVQSDENRNAYLDLLDENRQDRRMEQRLASLQEEEQSVNRQMVLAGAGVLILVLLVVYMSRRLRKRYRENYERERRGVEQEMAQWRARTDEDFLSLEEQQENVATERYMNERRLEEQKRRYVDKMTCLSLVYAVAPFLDRAVNEVKKMKGKAGEQRQESEQYLSELIDRINLYNDILTHWVKVRQGTVALNIENFELQGLFDILSKSINVFRNKGVELDVEPTNAVVKADRALTLFMMNTLLENARKYTPAGGKVSLRAEQTDDGVEISVSDTGRGLSPSDVEKILGEKVYDSSQIGDVEHDEELKKNKGFGFGLMNCKGIIEKYRKTNGIFSVCTFGIESTLGEGSRFFFKLPRGMMRVLQMCVLMLALGMQSCTHDVPPPMDSIHQQAAALPDDTLLEQASHYADQAYFSNLNGAYAEALANVDSACQRMNDYYLQEVPDGTLLLHLTDSVHMNEIELWNSGFITDYHIILDIRNEAAIAALALNQFDVYYYNNEIYTRLYKLMAQDATIEQFCNDIKAANTNKRTVLLIAIALMLLLLAGYFMVYYRNNILTTFNMRQILELNRRIFDNEDSGQLAAILEEGVNDIRRTDAVGLMFLDGSTQFSRTLPQQDYWQGLMQRCLQTGEKQFQENGRIRIYPLSVRRMVVNAEAEEEARVQTIGAMAIVLHQGNLQKGDDELFELIAQHAATNIYYATVRMERIHHEIELMEDERRRVEMETNHVHVQNMILDNCLSTIKHETMYYPSRIKQVLRSANVEDSERMTTINELITYYKEVYTLLSDCAARQLETVLFRRKDVPVADVATHAEKTFRRLYKKVDKDCEITFLAEVAPNVHPVIADTTMLQYLVENVLSALIDYKSSGILRLNIAESGEFVKFAFEFDGISLTAEQLHTLFYPDNLRYDAETDTLYGAQYLIARQIVREHDEHVRRGCRIYAEPLTAGTGRGVRIVFTIPVQMKKWKNLIRNNNEHRNYGKV